MALLLGSTARAQDDITRPDLSGRVVHHFDFEEPLVGTIRIPEHWVRAQHDAEVPRIRPGFPIWNAAELDGTVAYSGNVSVRVPVDAGSASLRLEPGVLPVFAGADYVIGAKVRTMGTQGSRARLVARLLDSSGRPVSGSEHTSELIATGGRWTDVHVMVHADDQAAAFIQIDLELVQPREFQVARLGRHQIWTDDHGAAAWFDDVVVLQVPRVELTTSAPSNIFVASELPQVRLDVRDMTGEALTGILRVLDDRGREVVREERAIHAGRHQETWTPTLGSLGWYRAILEIHHDGGLVGSASTDFLWTLDPSGVTSGAPTGAPAGVGLGAGRLGGGSIERDRFGLIVDAFGADLMSALPELVRRIGVGEVTLPAWAPDTTSDTVADRAMALTDLIVGLSRDWVDATLAFSLVPDQVVDQTRLATGDAVLFLADPDDSTWRPFVMPMLDHLGPRVRRWQVGPPGDDTAFWSGDLDATISRLGEAISGLVTMPELAVTWRSDRSLAPLADVAAHSNTSVSLLIPAAMPPSEIDELAEGVRDEAPGAALSVVLETLSEGTFGPRAAVDDLVKRGVGCWCAFGDDVRSMAIENPWHVSAGRRPGVMPEAELGAWRNLVDRLAERRSIGRFPGIAGVHCEILDATDSAGAGRGAMLVAWREPGSGAEPILEAPLGEGPVRVIDVFGNETIVEPVRRDGATGVHVIPIGDSPVFIEDVDVDLVGFVASFHVEPHLVPSTNEEHVVDIVLDNPWPMTISGSLYITEPGGAPPGGGAPDRSWRISPRDVRFSIKPGERARLPVSIAFSPYEEAGPRELIAQAQVSADRNLPLVRLAAPFEIGLDHLKLDATYRYADAGGHSSLVIEVVVTNTGDAPVLAELRAFPPDMARIKLPAMSVPPGRSIERRFVIAQDVESLRGRTVSINLSEVDARGSLNQHLRIE